jgi:hypothetical protein
LTRDDVEGLWKASRVGDDDLLCAVGGPWMRVGDFFAPPAVETPVSPAANASPSPAPVPIPVRKASQPLLMPIPLQPKQGGAPQNAPQPLAAAVPQAPAASGQSPNSRLIDQWFVRVRGIHSSPLKLQHVKALYQAREVTLDNVARHPSWSENDWRPLHSIPELAGITRP